MRWPPVICWDWDAIRSLPVGGIRMQTIELVFGSTCPMNTATFGNSTQLMTTQWHAKICDWRIWTAMPSEYLPGVSAQAMSVGRIVELTGLSRTLVSTDLHRMQTCGLVVQHGNRRWSAVTVAETELDDPTCTLYRINDEAA